MIWLIPLCKLIFKYFNKWLSILTSGGKFNNDFTAAYTISTAATRYLALPCLMADLYRGDQSLSSIHLVSGLIPFVMALAGNDNRNLGNIVIACNIVSLCVYSHEHDRIWGYYTAGAGVLAYFCTTQVATKITYPLFLALMEYCAYRVFHIHFSSPWIRNKKYLYIYLLFH